MKVQQIMEYSWHYEEKIRQQNLVAMLRHHTDNGMSIEDIMIFIEDLLIHDCQGKRGVK